MVMVKYLPERGTSDETETLRHTFNKKRPTEVVDPAVIAVLRGNPFFEVLDDDKGSKVAAPGIPTGGGPFVASEQSDGGFSIMSGPEVVKDGLTKEDADAFNALSDEDKAEYVAA